MNIARKLSVAICLVTTGMYPQMSLCSNLQQSITPNKLEESVDSNQQLRSKRSTSAYAGKTYVIIGASSGFGKGVAEKVGELGANVVLAARRTNLLEEIANNIRKNGGQALVVTTDISKAEDVEHLANAAQEKFGTIDVWINDTGVGALGKFEEIPVADEARLIDVNLKGIIYGSHAAIQIFKKQGYGTLINLGSIESEVPVAYQAAYAASKAGVLGLDKAIAQELRLAKTKRIRVSTVMPWAIDTPWWDHAANYSGGTPQMIGMDGPEEVINAIVHDSLHPKDEVLVGFKSKAASLSHRLMPKITERATANTSFKYQIETAPPAPPTDGTLITPMVSGTEVKGHVRERMKQQKENKAQRPNPNLQ
jgi:short-subunit dehydrogenase